MALWQVRLGLVGLVGLCAAVATTSGATPAPEAEPAPVVNDKQFHDKLLEIAKTYPEYGRVDDEMRWAPWLCRAPLPGRARFSRSSDEATHGKKLYSLFAKYRVSYLGQIGAEDTDATKKQDADQVIVKESWIPQEIKDPKDVLERPGRRGVRGDHFDPHVIKDGKTYKASKKGDLYIMMKLDPKTPDTDNGWVYGTVTPDGKTVTSAGKVASCTKCHETKPERLFGLGQVEKKGK